MGYNTHVNRGQLTMFTPPEILAEERRRAEEVYDRVVRPNVQDEDANKYVAIAFDRDDYEIDANDSAAINRLEQRQPGARLWLMRVGKQPAYRIRKR